MVHDNSIKNDTSRGFTIIEIMIVLSIVGIIMTIVFLAIPSLQRSSRNNQRKRDANIMAVLLNEYIVNNGGQLPGDCSGNPGPNCDTVFLLERDFSYYETKNVSFKFRSDALNDGFPVYNGPGNVEWITIANYYRCQTLPDGSEQAIHNGAGYKNLVLIYELETAGAATVKKCQGY
jgi:prepilin-type N-terminal cleavage/methylation domain-containing protein